MEHRHYSIQRACLTGTLDAMKEGTDTMTALSIIKMIEHNRQSREMFFATLTDHWDITPHQIHLATGIGDWETLLMFVAGMDALNREGKAEQAKQEEATA